MTHPPGPPRRTARRARLRHPCTGPVVRRKSATPRAAKKARASARSGGASSALRSVQPEQLRRARQKSSGTRTRGMCHMRRVHAPVEVLAAQRVVVAGRQGITTRGAAWSVQRPRCTPRRGHGRRCVAGRSCARRRATQHAAALRMRPRSVRLRAQRAARQHSARWEVRRASTGSGGERSGLIGTRARRRTIRTTYDGLTVARGSPMAGSPPRRWACRGATGAAHFRRTTSRRRTRPLHQRHRTRRWLVAPRSSKAIYITPA